MIRHWTGKELLENLKKLTVIADTREQKNSHITDYLDEKKICHVSRKLDIGDYSAELDGMTFEKDFCIERKHNLDEICGNLTADRDRFEREFMRAKAFGTKVYLIIEDASWDDVYLQNYRSKLSSKSLIASLMAWQARYNVTIIFCNHENSPKIITQILYYAARDKLIYG